MTKIKMNKNQRKCECGVIVHSSSLSKHKLSNKHKILMGYHPLIKVKPLKNKIKRYQKCECDAIVNSNSIHKHRLTTKHKISMSTKILSLFL